MTAPTATVSGSHLSEASNETVSVRFDILHAYAEANGLDYNELCAMVRDAIAEGSQAAADAYLNMREWAAANGLDTTTYGASSAPASPETKAWMVEQQHPTRPEVSRFFTEVKRCADEYRQIGWTVTPLHAQRVSSPHESGTGALSAPVATPEPSVLVKNTHWIANQVYVSDDGPIDALHEAIDRLAALATPNAGELDSLRAECKRLRDALEDLLAIFRPSELSMSMFAESAHFHAAMEKLDGDTDRAIDAARAALAATKEITP